MGIVGRASHDRTTSLISHCHKILTQIIYKWIEKQAESDLGEELYGFRRTVGTPKAILTLQHFLEDWLRKTKYTFLDFIDLDTAFDNVNWNTLFLNSEGSREKSKEMKSYAQLAQRPDRS